MIHNFYAGPSIIAPEILEQASKDILHKDDLLSILEISHRSKRFGELIDELYDISRKVLNLSDLYDIVFLQGGGRQQFYQIPYNLSQTFSTNYYVDSGHWAHGAMEESSYFGKTESLASSQSNGYKNIPTWEVEPEDANYIYICTNNTIYGTHFSELPNTKAPLIADMSSDLLGRNVEYNKMDLFYAATQKNAGTSGACIVVIKRGLLKKPKGSLPSLIDYRTQIEKKSLYQTPPVFAFLLTLLVMKWVQSKGGVDYFDQYNREKANLLYDEIERNECFIPYADKKDRSTMNAVFTGVNKHLEERFLKFATQRQIVGINGHRSIGGFRASMYNALPKESVEFLVDCMKEFEQKHS